MKISGGTGGEYDKLYGKETQAGRPIDFDNAMNVTGTTFGIGAASEKLSKSGYKNFNLIAKPFAIYNAYSASQYVFSPNATPINYMDFGVGLLDLGASIEVLGRFNPYIGGATLLYGVGRIGYDYYQSNTMQYYGPTYYTNGKVVRLW